MAIFDADNEITDILPLNQREVVFVADHFYNIASYSIDKHFPMKLHLPKTSVTGTSENMENMLQPVMVASSNEEYVFYLSERKNFVFDWNSVANSKEFTLEGDPDNVKKAIQFEGYIIVMTEVQGLFIYKINQETRIPYLIQKIGVKNSYSPPVDIELNKNTQMLYVLNYESTIDVYLFDPKNNTKTNKETILHPRDTINLTNITKNHGS